MADLEPGQVEIGGITLGPGTDYIISVFPGGGKPDTAAADTARAREDGISFGRDKLGGLTLALEVTVDTDDLPSARAAYGALASAWDAAAARATPGATVPMRMRHFDGPTVVVFGRPRRFDPANMDLMHAGRVDVVADYQATDHLYYSDTVYSTSVTIIPPPVGGLTDPLTDPLVGVASGQVQGQVDVGGDEPAWLVTRVNGPIVDPELFVTGLWTAKLRLTLASGEYLDVDPQPWSRRVRRNGQSSEAGAFTAQSQRLTAMRVPPGGAEVGLRGIDATGTASAQFSWRTAYSSY